MTRPHWSETSPEAGAYRLAELAADRGDGTPVRRESTLTPARVRGMIAARQGDVIRWQDAVARLQRRIEKAEDDIDRMDAWLAARDYDPTTPRMSRAEYVIGEVEALRGSRPLADLAAALGYADPASLTTYLRRHGRADLIPTT